MLPKDRVASLFAGRPTDRPPIYMGSWSSWAASFVLGREAYVGGGIQQYREACALWAGPDAHAEFIARSARDALDIAVAAGLDYVRPSYWRMSERPTGRLDERTFRYGADDNWRVMRFDPDTELYQVIGRAPAPQPTLADIERRVEEVEAAEPSALKSEDFPDLRWAIERLGHERAVHGSAPSCALPHDAIWLEAIALRPDLVRRYVLALARNGLPRVSCMAAIGTPYLHGGGDFASNSGPFYSPRAFHDIMLPGLQMISEQCHRHGCYHMFASDGDLWPVADDLFGASGVDAFYEIDVRAGMDLRRLRERFPRLVLLGGINSHTLHTGTVDDVRRETMDAMAAAQELGGIMVGCSNLIMPGTPYANIEAMLEALRM